MANTRSVAFLAAFVGVVLPHQVAGYNITNEVQTFYSVRNQFSFRSQKTYLIALQRPDLSPPRIEVTSFNENLTTPGYFLITPYSPSADSDLASGSGGSSTTVQIQNGPYIYDSKGVSMIQSLGNLFLT